MSPVRFASLAGLLMLACFHGCGPRDPKTYPVSGKVVFKGGDIQKLQGWMVQFQAVAEHDTRANAEIGDGGAFKAVSLVNNHGKEGVVEGEQRVCVVNVLQPESKVLNRKFNRFDTSGIIVNVPLEGDLVIEVSK